MPIQILDAATAFENNRQPNSAWPRTPEAQAARLTGIAKPVYQPSFQIDAKDRIYTMGSCFARNVEAQLMQLGMNVAAADLRFPEHLAIAGDRGRAMLNKFVVQSIESEIRWALDPSTPFPKESLWEMKPGRFVDPFLGNSLAPQSLDDVMARREIITNWFAKIVDAKVVIITLGLAEAWFDTQTQAYLNIAPPRSMRNADPDRLQLHILSYDDVIGSLERIHALLSQHLAPDWKMLVTVSPVALGSSFSGKDALIANTYSKSVQRAAVQAFVIGHDNVDYFPSYESIMLSNRELAWEEDQAHVSAMAVRSNMLRMVQAYAGASADVSEEQMGAGLAALDLTQAASALSKNGQMDEALRLYEAASATSNDPNILVAHGRFLTTLERYDEAAVILKRAADHGGEHFGVHYMLGNALRLARRFEEADPEFALAIEREPNKPGILFGAAKVKAALRKNDQAAILLKRVLALTPENASAMKMLGALEGAPQGA